MSKKVPPKTVTVAMGENPQCLETLRSFADPNQIRRLKIGCFTRRSQQHLSITTDLIQHLHKYDAEKRKRIQSGHQIKNWFEAAKAGLKQQKLNSLAS